MSRLTCFVCLAAAFGMACHTSSADDKKREFQPRSQTAPAVQDVPPVPATRKVPVDQPKAAVPAVPTIQDVQVPQFAPLAVPAAPVIRQGYRLHHPQRNNWTSGVPLHHYGSTRRTSGGRFRGGNYGRRSSVEYSSGVRGVRVSEWPSPTTGLTLSEEQRMGIRNVNGFVPQTNVYSTPASGYVQGTSFSVIHQPLPPKRPTFNIPDYVW